jgi:guanosine-3',5'-bis(diphosphate) 3'-pyrophosphohydrolase
MKKDRRIPSDPADSLAHASLLSALRFAADKHRDHRRKDSDASPYINHPIAVAEVLARIGRVTDLAVLQAAVLHDTIEDTATTEAELEQTFGADVSRLVAEVTDDKSLPKAERKRLQVQHAPHLSRRAKLIKLSDKICNVHDVTHSPPEEWSVDRRREYLDWSRQVVAGCRGVCSDLELYFDQLTTEGEAAIGA